MWKLTHVSASNFVSFKELDLELTQGVATLLYGINKDNENQKNNGTGKSSLLEIIAFGITGDSIKKVPNTNDIINNYEEEASVCLSFLTAVHALLENVILIPEFLNFMFAIYKIKI